MVVPEQKDNTHFVANLRIEKVEKTPATRDRGVTDGPQRLVHDVTNLTIRADTLEGLTEKLGKHIAIIEED